MKDKGCLITYSGIFLSVNNNFEIYGLSNVINGWNEQVCVSCSDYKGFELARDNLIFTQNESPCLTSLSIKISPFTS